MDNNAEVQNSTMELDIQLSSVKYDIGTKEGNKEALETLNERINNICNTLNLKIGNSLYFVPKSDEYYTIHELLVKNDLVSEMKPKQKVNYYIRVVDDLITLQKSRVTFPSLNSNFNKYYLDTLYFLNEGRYPLYKDNQFDQILKNAYAHQFFVDGQKVINEVLDIDHAVETCLKTLKNTIQSGDNDDDALNSAYSTAIGKLEKQILILCDKLSNEVEKEKDLDINDLAELIFNLFHVAFVSLENDINIKKRMKLIDFPERNEQVLKPIISVLDISFQQWLPLGSLIESITSVIGKGTLNLKQTIKIINNVYRILSNDAKNSDILVYNPNTIPFKNGNYNIMTKQFDANPCPFDEPVPARLRVKYNRNADYKNYDKYGVTPFSFVTFPFVNGDYSQEEAKKREIYAGHVITDVLVPFNRNIGGESIYWFTGDGGSGKTTYIEMLQNLVGNGQTSSVEMGLLDKDKFALGDITGKYLLVGNEATDSGSLGVLKLKQLASGDRVPFEEKYEQSRTTIPTVTTVITSNGAPNLKQDGGSSARRFKILRFNIVFESDATSDLYRSKTPVKNVPQIRTHALKDEYFLECIANYAIDMLEEHAKRTEFSVTLPIPQSVKNDTEQAVKQSDTVSEFSEFIHNLSFEEPIPLYEEHLYTVYEIYTKAVGKEKYQVSPEKFKNEIIMHKDDVLKLKSTETYDCNGKTLRYKKRMTKQEIVQTQKDLVNNISGSHVIEGLENHIQTKSNTISKNSTPYSVLWLLPTQEEKATYMDMVEESKRTGEDIPEEAVPF